MVQHVHITCINGQFVGFFCGFNFYDDDLFVHSLTNLIALLLIALIRLERVTPDVSDRNKGIGG